MNRIGCVCEGITNCSGMKSGGAGASSRRNERYNTTT
jgi:hypothetical protein